ncbi:MAG: SpoIVB peptidase S55 domain-containing protein, partial [Syntrophomonadaceae bacterium]|nr:SpoIVB peptidase S55 domain-containing protein [Syntrophomonadaceae bacterium]
MKSTRIRPVIGLVLCALMLALVFSPRVSALLSLPQQQRMVVGQEDVIQLELPLWLQDRLEISLWHEGQELYPAVEDPALTLGRVGKDLYEISALQPGNAQLKLSLFGYIAVRTIEVEALPARTAVPGGHSIGVILHSKGVMVVGFAMVETDTGHSLYPAREQGVQIGDVVVEVDGVEVRDETELARIIDRRQGQPTTLKIIRAGEAMEIEVQGVYCRETDRFRIGLYVRDSVVGVGTLSFWNPQTGQYAALGHRIEDAGTGQMIDVQDGRLVSASIQAIKPGRPGAPGEKIGVLSENGLVSGDITSNTEAGIFGNTTQKITNPLYGRSLELSYAHQVQEGPAQMLT